MSVTHMTYHSSYLEPLGLATTPHLTGHGIGRDFHENPMVSHHPAFRTGNCQRNGRSMTRSFLNAVCAGYPCGLVGCDTIEGIMQAGMVFTIEPIVTYGEYCHVWNDNWYVVVHVLNVRIPYAQELYFRVFGIGIESVFVQTCLISQTKVYLSYHLSINRQDYCVC